MSLTIKICKNTIILSNKAFSSLKETYLSFRDYPNLRHRCPLCSATIFSTNNLPGLILSAIESKDPFVFTIVYSNDNVQDTFVFSIVNSNALVICNHGPQPRGRVGDGCGKTAVVSLQHGAFSATESQNPRYGCGYK